MKKIRLVKVSCSILLFVLFMQKMCMQACAAELELEPNPSGNGNPFQFEISYTWTSDGQKMRSYDVSENGQIAIVFSNNTIGVFDNDMNFLYQLSYKTNGASGVLWLGESLLFIDIRSDAAIVCGDNGLPEYFYKITGPVNYTYDVLGKRSRRQGNDEYCCIRSGGSDSPLIHYGYYTMLRRTLANGEDEILYEMEVPNDQKFIESGGIMFSLAVLYGTVAIAIRIYRKRVQKR